MWQINVGRKNIRWDWKVTELESEIIQFFHFLEEIEKFQNWEVSELESVRIGKCQNWKVS